MTTESTGAGSGSTIGPTPVPANRPANRPASSPASSPVGGAGGSSVTIASIPTIARGTLHLCFATDIASAIDLDRAASLVKGPAQRTGFRERRTPSHLQIDPPPLRFEITVDPIDFGAVASAGHAEIELFDFGGALVTFKVPLPNLVPLPGLVPLSESVYEHAGLASAAERLFGDLARQFASALLRPQPRFPLEDYAIFQVASFTAPHDPSTLLREHAATIAAILRAEPGPLSTQEIAESLGQSISYRPNDILVVDWNAAFAIDADFESVETMLGVANVELAELRLLDRTLDGLLDRAYEQLPHRTLRDRIGLGPVRHELRRLAALQMDAALLFEQVNNAVKLFGDEYLARAYRLASRRLHIPDWDESVRRKLDTLDRIYSTVSDEQANRRIELLEWIIILLIAWEVVRAFFP